jgi:hypothetical protein
VQHITIGVRSGRTDPAQLITDQLNTLSAGQEAMKNDIRAVQDKTENSSSAIMSSQIAF